MNVDGEAQYDFAIIGSGVSGGRIAHELTAAGASCVLLEAGNEYAPSTFPTNELDSSSQLFWGGGIEVSRDGRLAFLRARCLGGTSIVNQALLDRFDDVAWDDWRARSGIDWMAAPAMEPHYAACESGVPISEIPRHNWGRNSEIFTAAFDDAGLGWSPLRRAQGDCALDRGSDCIVCLGGCPRESKQSALVTTIRWARARGLTVATGVEVHHVDATPGGVVVHGASSGQATMIRARRAVLAAGAIGNSAILLRSAIPGTSPAIGHGFACHPQMMSYGVFSEQVDAHRGAFQSVKSSDERLRSAGLKLENVYAPPIGTAMLVPGHGAAHHARMRRYRSMASMEVAIRDEAVGRIRIGRRDRLIIDKTLTDADQERLARGRELVDGLLRRAGATEVIHCEDAFGLHLMGGCALGTDPATSVVDPSFRVHGAPSLFVADSSVFPSAPGINPSFTVAALSHRAAREMLASV